MSDRDTQHPRTRREDSRLFWLARIVGYVVLIGAGGMAAQKHLDQMHRLELAVCKLEFAAHVEQEEGCPVPRMVNGRVTVAPIARPM